MFLVFATFQACLVMLANLHPLFFSFLLLCCDECIPSIHCGSVGGNKVRGGYRAVGGDELWNGYFDRTGVQPLGYDVGKLRCIQCGFDMFRVL